MLCCSRFKACRFNSCFPQAKRIVVWHQCVRFSDPTIFLSGKLGICLVFLSWSRLLCVREDGEGEKEAMFKGKVMQSISSNLQFDLQGRHGVPGLGLWRENRAQAWGSLLWLSLVKLFFTEKRTLSPTEKGARNTVDTAEIFYTLKYLVFFSHTQEHRTNSSENMKMLLNKQHFKPLSLSFTISAFH